LERGNRAWLKGVLFLLCLSFLAFYFLLAYHTRFSEEDFDLLISFRGNGWLETIKYYYFNWSCRWASLSYFYLWFGHVRSYEGLRYMILFYSGFSISALIYLVFRLLRAGVEFGVPVIFSALSGLTISILFCATLFFFMFQTSEVFFWVIASLDQLQPIIFCCLFAFMVIKEKHWSLDYFFILLSGFYIGGASELFALLLFSLILFFLLFKFSRNWRLDFLKTIQGKKILLGFLALSLSLAFSLTAPGTAKRKAYENLHAEKIMNQGMSISATNPDAMSWKKMLTQRKNSMTLVLVFTLLMSISLQAGEKKHIPQEFRPAKNVLLLLGLICLYAFAVFTIGFHLVFPGGAGPERGWAPFNFIALACIFIWGCSLVPMLKLQEKSQAFVATGFALLSIVLLNTYIIRQYPIIKNYAEFYDSAIRLFEHSTRQDTGGGPQKGPSLGPLNWPEPGMLVPNKIREDQFERLHLETE
jgi:hypothetical protein